MFYFFTWACMHVCAQLCSTLWDPMDYSSPPGSSVYGIIQARILEWDAISFSRGSSWPRNWTQVSCIEGRFFTVWATRKALWLNSMSAKSLQLCLTLCNPMGCNQPGSSVHGILQARILEQVAMPSSRESSRPKDQTCSSCIAGRLFTAEPLGKPNPGIPWRYCGFSSKPQQ